MKKQNTAGDRDIKAIVWAIFGKNSPILYANSRHDFEREFARFQDSEMAQHFDPERLDRLHDQLWLYCIEPGLKHPSLKPGWINNRVESVNAATKGLSIIDVDSIGEGLGSAKSLLW